MQSRSQEVRCTMVLVAAVGLAVVLSGCGQEPARHDGTESAAAPHEHEHEHGSGDAHECEAHSARRVPIEDLDAAELFAPVSDEPVAANITYTLPTDARVSIRVKRQGTRELFLATIVGWEDRSAGTHTETWDRRDYSGNVVDMRSAGLVVVAERPDDAVETMPIVNDEQALVEVIHGHASGHEHETHAAYAEEVPKLSIVEPAAGAVLSGEVAVRCEVDADRRGYGNEFGYGVRYYVDGVLAHEEFYKPECDGKFSFQLDTLAFTDGEHMLYVGMCDHHEHATSAGIQVTIANTPK